MSNCAKCSHWRFLCCARIKELLEIFFKISLCVLWCLMVLQYYSALTVSILGTLISVNCWGCRIVKLLGMINYSYRLRRYSWFKDSHFLIIIWDLNKRLHEWVPQLLKVSSCISPHFNACSFELFKCALVIFIDTLVLFHHKNLRIHLWLLKSFTPHLCLEGLISCRINPLNMLESWFNFMLCKFTFMYHELVGLLMQELVARKNHFQFLQCHIISDGFKDVMR